MMTLLFIGLYTSVNAATITGQSPYGNINIQVNDGIPPKQVILPGATTMSSSFPVTYDDGKIHVTFPVYYDDGTTFEDILRALIDLFF